MSRLNPLCNRYPFAIFFAFYLLFYVSGCQHAGYSVTVKKIEEKSDKPIYSISAALLQLSQLPDTGTQNTINNAIAYYVQSQVAQFKEDITQSQRGGNTRSSLTGTSAGELQIETTTGLNTKNMVSVRVTTLYHNTEAAYPEYLERCFTFDTRNGEMLHLDRLFVPGSEYLKVISEYVYPRIRAQQQSDGFDVDTALLKKATQPVAVNFNTFLLHPDRISFFFPYYKVSSQHQPDVWADVPYSMVKPYLLKQYRW